MVPNVWPHRDIPGICGKNQPRAVKKKKEQIFQSLRDADREGAEGGWGHSLAGGGPRHRSWCPGQKLPRAKFHQISRFRGESSSALDRKVPEGRRAERNPAPSPASRQLQHQPPTDPRRDPTRGLGKGNGAGVKHGKGKRNETPLVGVWWGVPGL